MNAVFADTFFFLALLNDRDASHRKALDIAALESPIVTTAWVITELADAFCAPENRPAFLQLLDTLKASADAHIIEATPDLFERGVDLFRQRPDKDWSLTDCVSFVAMHDAGITEALTGDRHFEQAGFRALLK